MSLTEIPINMGTFPESDRQVNNPRLREGFVNKEGHVQLLPNLSLQQSFNNIRSIKRSTFNNRLIVVTVTEVFYIDTGVVTKVGEITFSSNAVRIDENQRNQIIIVNGNGAWVFDQQTNGFSKLNTADNGFDIVNPVDVVVLNTITIIVGGTDKRWIVSLANNALQYQGNEVVVTDTSLGNLTGCEHWNNNLFIFGESGVQRWLPSTERTTFDFPFSQDPSYRDELGCISTGSLVSENNQLFYLSENGQVRYISDSGRRVITNDGIENIIRFFDEKNSFGSYFYFDGYYIYILSFPSNLQSFVFVPLTNKWSETKQVWYEAQGTTVALDDGIYDITEDFSAGKQLVIQTPYIYPKQPQMELRAILSAIIVELTQGKGQTNNLERAYLQLSKDNILFGNKVSRDLSKTAQRLRQLRWHMSYSNTGFTMRLTFDLLTNLTITRATARWV